MALSLIISDLMAVILIGLKSNLSFQHFIVTSVSYTVSYIKFQIKTQNLELKKKSVDSYCLLELWRHYPLSKLSVLMKICWVEDF